MNDEFFDKLAQAVESEDWEAVRSGEGLEKYEPRPPIKRKVFLVNGKTLPEEGEGVDFEEYDEHGILLEAWKLDDDDPEGPEIIRTYFVPYTSILYVESP